MDTRLYLKIKISSLTEEARIIKAEERRQKAYSRSANGEDRRERSKRYLLGLKEHRRRDVRDEQRATLLAYGYIRGKSYLEIEGRNCSSSPQWDRVTAMVSKYGERYTTEEAARLKAWIADAVASRKAQPVKV